MPEKPIGTGTGMQRLFFAVWPDAATRAHLAALAGSLRKEYPARWIRPGRYHLTLCFVGAEACIATARIARARQAAACVKASARVWRPDRVTGFRARRPPCVVMGDTPDPMLQRLHRKLCEALADHQGRVAERRHYVPHVTLGYGRDAVITRQAIAALVFPVRSFALLLSVPGEADYRELGRWDLAEE